MYYKCIFLNYNPGGIMNKTLHNDQYDYFYRYRPLSHSFNRRSYYQERPLLLYIVFCQSS